MTAECERKKYLTCVDLLEKNIDKKLLDKKTYVYGDIMPFGVPARIQKETSLLAIR